MSDEKTEVSEPTLSQFIEDSHKLISALAILAGLSAFANNLPDKDVGKVLSFLLFALALLVETEIVLKCPMVRRGRLYWFHEIFTLTMLLFGFAWVHMYYPYLLGLLFMVVGLLVIVLFFALCKEAIRRMVSKIPSLKNKSQRTREEFIPTFGAMFLMMLVYLTLKHLKVI
jgi:apolipoprotein N-acyltransferase